MGGTEAIWGGQQRLICCVDGHRWTRWPSSALPPSLLRSHGCCRCGGARVLVGSERGGRKSVHNVGVDRLSWKCCHFRCHQQLVLKTCLHVFPACQPDTADVLATSCDVGFIFSVLYVVSLLNCRLVVVVVSATSCDVGFFLSVSYVVSCCVVT
jgi:hypothetical protein